MLIYFFFRLAVNFFTLDDEIEMLLCFTILRSLCLTGCRACARVLGADPAGPSCSSDGGSAKGFVPAHRLVVDPEQQFM